MYKAKLIEVQPDPQYPNISVCTIQFEKDGAPFGELDNERGFTHEQLIKYCRDKIKKLQEDEKQESGMSSLINNPPLGEVDTSLPLETINEAAEEALEVAISKLSTIKQQIDLKIIDENNLSYQEALLDAKNKKEILDFLNT